jgi:hypothetical protein
MEKIRVIGIGIHLLLRWMREWFAKNVPQTIDALAGAAYHLNLAEKLLFLPGLRRRGDPAIVNRNAKAVVKMHATHSLLRSLNTPIHTPAQHLPVPRTCPRWAVSRCGIASLVSGVRRPIPQK